MRLNKAPTVDVRLEEMTGEAGDAVSMMGEVGEKLVRRRRCSEKKLCEFCMFVCVRARVCV